MNGEQFKGLGLEQQVRYINSRLEQGATVDNIRIALGVGKNYIGNTFKKGGYVKDRATGLYIKAGQENINTTNTTALNKANEKVTNDKQSINNTKLLESRIESLERQIEGIMAILETTNNTNTTIATNETEIKIFEGKKVTRSYKVDEEVQKQFKAFCKARSEYSVGDILANAMLELMNKYK